MTVHSIRIAAVWFAAVTVLMPATLSVAHADEPLAFRSQWFGRVGYFATGATLAIDGLDAGMNVDRLIANSVDVRSADVPADAVLVDAYLYWGGSVAAGGVDNDVVFTPPGGQPISVVADGCYSSAASSLREMQLCRVSVGHLLPTFVGTYAVDGFDALIENSATDNASFSIVLIYEHPSLPPRRVVIHDGLITMVSPTNTTAVVEFMDFGALAAIPQGSLTWYALEGDTGGTGTEAVAVDGVPGPAGPVTLGDANNPTGNPMNQTINTTSPPQTAVIGVDIDRFDITAALSPSDTSIEMTYSAGTDKWWLAYNIISVDVEPEADIEVSPVSVDFGDVEVGTSAPTVVRVSNVGFVDLALSGISLTSGADFSLTSLPGFPATLAPGASLDVTVTFSPSVSGPVAASLEVISDDPDQESLTVPVSGTGVMSPLPAVSIAATDSTATEAGLTPGAFRVTRTGSTGSPLTVVYSVRGTATPGSDYAVLAGTVTIAAGRSTAKIVVTPVDDLLMERNETVVATLLSDAAYTVGTRGSARVTIVSDETVSISAIDARATEAGSSMGAFRVTRTGNTASPLTVVYSVSGTATPGSDYTALPGSVIIAAGQATADIIVTPVNDVLMEANETVIATLVANAAYSMGASRTATVTIVSNERVSISTIDSTATEAGRTTAAFRVTRNGSTASSVTVVYSVTGTAAPGSDYAALSGSVIIPAGQTTADIIVTPVNDALTEGNETVAVTLVADSAYAIGTPRTATVTILSNE